jgi:hypothetical protein
MDLPPEQRDGTRSLQLRRLHGHAHTRAVVGEVNFHPHSERLPERGSWCFNSGPPADYNWSVSGETLTRTPVGGKDASGIRGFSGQGAGPGSADDHGWR